MAPKGKRGKVVAKEGKDTQANNSRKDEADAEEDIIAALDAQAEQIGDLLESRVDEIDAHWRQSGSTKPGAVPKSAAQAGELGAKAKAATPVSTAALGADAKVGSLVQELGTPLGAAGAKVAPPAKAPPFKAPPAKAPPAKAQAPPVTLPPEESGATGDDEDDDYDPFSELPSVSAEDVVKDLMVTVQAMQAESNRTIRSLQAMQAKLAAADAKVAPTPPWRKKQTEYIAPASGISLAELKGNLLPPPPQNVQIAAPPQTKAAAPMGDVPMAGSQPSKRKTERIDAASERATKYFKPADEKPVAQKEGTSGVSAGKEKSAEVTVTFAQEVLSKTPATLQTCRSLLLFLDKKLQAPIGSCPTCGGPEDLRARLESYADDGGRILGLRAGGWDARVKRIVDIGDLAASSAGQALISAAEQAHEKARPELEKELQERGEHKLDDLISERQKWTSQECVKRDVLSWCAKVLRAREAILLTESGAEAKDVAGSQIGKSGGLGPLAIVEAILKGSSGMSPSKAGG